MPSLKLSGWLGDALGDALATRIVLCWTIYDGDGRGIGLLVVADSVFLFGAGEAGAVLEHRAHGVALVSDS
ncbi:MAG: hypothetical protein U0Y68_07345 [Blastocatellia bacterium]